MAKSDDETIRLALEQWAYAEAELGDNRERARADLEFGRLGEQWPEEIKKLRAADNRPMLTINRIPAFIRQVVNDARLNKPSIKVRPVDNDADVETAQVIQGLIRNIESASNADIAYDTAIDYAVSCGIGFMRVDLNYSHNDTFEMDIEINQIENVMSVLFDPDTNEFDSRDWDFAFVGDVLSTAKFEQKYPKAQKIDWSAWSGTEGWYTEEEGIRVAEYWTRSEFDRTLLMLSNGTVVAEDALTDEMKARMVAQNIVPTQERKIKGHKIKQQVINGVEVLEEVEWTGSIIPIVPVYGDVVNVNGRRWWRSLFHDAKDAQRQINYWRTAATELVALAPKAPFIGPEDAFEGYEEMWQNANVKSYAYLPYKGGIAPQRQVFGSNVAAEMQQAVMANDDMKSIMGLYDASLGARSNETSGKAILARQREGDVSTFHLTDNLSRAIQCVGEIIVELIPNVYSEERIIRVLGDDGKPDMVTINKRVEGENGYDEVLKNLTVGKYDVIVEAGPSYTTRRQEAAEAMVEMVRSFPDAAPLLGDMIARSMDWPDADKVADRLKALLPEEIRRAEEAKEQAASEEMDVQTVMARAEQEIAKRDQQIQQLMEQGEKVMQEAEQVKGLKSEVENATKDLQRQQQHLDDTRRVATAELKTDKAQAEAALTKQFASLENKVENLVKSISADAGMLEDIAVQEAMALIQQEMAQMQGMLDQMGSSQSAILNQFIQAVQQPVTIQRDDAGRVMGAQRAPLPPQGDMPPIPEALRRT